jgi:hypothetical protein
LLAVAAVDMKLAVVAVVVVCVVLLLQLVAVEL